MKNIKLKSIETYCQEDMDLLVQCGMHPETEPTDFFGDDTIHIVIFTIDENIIKRYKEIKLQFGEETVL